MLSPLGGPLLAQALAQAVLSVLPGALRPEALLAVILLHDCSQTYSCLLWSLTQHEGEDKATEGHCVQRGEQTGRKMRLATLIDFCSCLTAKCRFQKTASKQ